LALLSQSPSDLSTWPTTIGTHQGPYIMKCFWKLSSTLMRSLKTVNCSCLFTNHPICSSWRRHIFTDRTKKIIPRAACSACRTTQPDATFQIHSASGTLQLLRKRLRNSRGRHKQHDRRWPLTIVPTHLLFRPPNVQQDGGDLFLQREECPPDRLDQDLPQSLVPRRCQEHPGPLQVLYRWGSEKDLLFGQQHIRVNSLGKINTNHVCPKAKSISAIQISSGQTVQINPSCYIRTMDHIITADDSEEIEIHSKWLNWTWTLGQLFQQLENGKVTEAIDRLRQKISCKFDTEILINELQTMTKEAKEKPIRHWTFTTPGAMIGGAVISLLLLFCCWRMCCNPGNNTYPAPSAPPATTLILKQTVDPIRR
jgi:hypothetical protein